MALAAAVAGGVALEREETAYEQQESARWPEDDQFVNLLRRSVMSLVPALAQTLIWSIFGRAHAGR
jgi:hypothetical protein